MIKKLEGVNYRGLSFLILLVALSTLVVLISHPVKVFAQPLQFDQNPAQFTRLYSDADRAFFWESCRGGPDVLVKDPVTGLLITCHEIYYPYAVESTSNEGGAPLSQEGLDGMQRQLDSFAEWNKDFGEMLDKQYD